MKFEKFLKQTGTHGTVIERSESEKWLVCDGVGMVIPRGVDNLLGTPTNSEYVSIVNALANAAYDDPVELKKAILLDPTGSAKAIYRVFGTDFGDTVGIINTDYGLLEKSDRLGYGEIETEEKTVKYILVYDHNNSIIGFITGSDKF
jgi:hypothetical protein